MHEQFNSMRERLIAWHARPHYRQGGVGANRAPRHRKNCFNILPASARKRKRGTKTEEQEGKKREQKRRGGGTRSRNPNDTQSHTDPESQGGGRGGTGGRPLFVHSEAAYEQRVPPGTWGNTHQTPAQSLRESLTSSSP